MKSVIKLRKKNIHLGSLTEKKKQNNLSNINTVCIITLRDQVNWNYEQMVYN